MARVRLAILISGRGSNMQALLQAAHAPDFPAEVALVLSNEPKAAGLAVAREAGVETAVVDHRSFGERGAFEEEVTRVLRAHGVELVCQAGFMRIVTAFFVAQWYDRLLNIHPSLLPAFPGLNTHKRALEAGVKLHGCTVHFVRERVDSGPIIGQAAVPVRSDDTEESLAKRVLMAEHRLYPLCLSLVARGKAHVDGQHVRLQIAESEEATLINPPPGGLPD